MIFSSIAFLYYFLPVAILLYFAVPTAYKNFVLFIVTLIFYGWGEPKFVIVMLISMIVGYVSGLLMEKYVKNKVLLLISIGIPIGFLLYFKYAGFFIENFVQVTGMALPVLQVTLPIGISFYTFQIVSYQIDVYNGAKAQRNFVNLGAYIAMFPQLIAGPIICYGDIERELESRKHSYQLIAEGAVRFCVGLGKKVIIANTLASLVELTKEATEPSVVMYWMYAVAVALQIYFDFSGYSDMAIGLGKIFGFRFLENFNYPFVATSIGEFWRRWHISLGRWFRNYVYIPLGGNRVKLSRWLLNVVTVWFLTGFWHGAQWTFIVWGLYFAFWLVLEKLVLERVLKRKKALSHCYVLLITAISFVIFDSEGLGAFWSTLKAMTGFSGIPLVTAETAYYFNNYAIILLASAVGATPRMKKLVKKLPDKVVNVIEVIYVPAMVIVSTAFLVDGAFNPFLYFRF